MIAEFGLSLTDFLTWYLFAASLPIIFLALFAAFRWRYGRMIRNAIYAASSFARCPPDTSADAGQSVAITLRWSDAASIAGDAISRPRGEARRETRAVSLAFITAGIAYIAMSMAVIQCCNAAASLLVGYINSLPALIVTSVFARGGWSVALAVATSWAALLLLMLSNDLGPHEALKITLYTMLTVAPQAIAVGLLLPRTTRVLLVGFAPVFGVMGLLALGVVIDGWGGGVRFIVQGGRVLGR